MTHNKSAKRRHAGTAAPAGPTGATSPALLAAGAIFIALSAVMSLLLVLEHLGGLSLPGCGEGGACEQAINGVWGKVKLGTFEWPTSYLGLAYFLAALVAWIAARGVVPGAFRYLVRLGALASLGFCVIIVREWLFCPYCVAAHVGNFAFWITLEATRRRPAHSGPALVNVAGVFVLASVALGVWDWQHRVDVAAKAEVERSAAAHSIIERSREPQATAPAPETKAPAAASQPVAPPLVAPAPVASAPATKPAVAADLADARPFEGRYRHGPEAAPIRIVLLTGYQCPDCYNIEQQVEKLYGRPDVAISIKHFPFASECNPCVTRDMHPNACWAARAAEAAGTLWGTEGFWKMHKWLFARKGVFETQQELDNGIREMGYDPAGFVPVMSSEETLRRIREDAKEGEALGLHFTPMIFINGVELKGWWASEALTRTVEQVAATNPPARTAAFDHPPTALDKYLTDWRDQPIRQLPPDAQAWTTGPQGARIQIVAWGDYQEPFTAEADKTIRDFMARRGDVSYTFRHCPFNSDCNPSVKDKRHPLACRTAQAAEAAGRLGGNEAYWKMHIWLMENQKQVSDQTLAAEAASIGLDADAFMAALASPEVQANIADDLTAGTKLPVLRYGMPPGLNSIPSIFINGRYIPRWRLGEQAVLDKILDAAAADIGKVSSGG